MSTRELTLADFEETVSGEGIVLVDFWAAWCGPCRQFAPVFEAAAEANPDIVFGKVDTEAEQQLAGMAGITSIPTLMLFRDGILLFNQAGALPPQALEGVIQQARELDMDAVRAEVEKAQQTDETGAVVEVDLDNFAAAHAGGAYVVDVREDAEWEGGRVPGAVHVPMNTIPDRIGELPKDSPVFVICASGNRSRQVSDFLRAQGVDAINVAGGTNGWAQRGWPLDSGR
jgi:thioredoxin